MEITEISQEETKSEITQKIEMGHRYKEEGNRCFKEKNYSKAKSKYGIALAYITGFPGSKRNQTGYETLLNQTIRSTRATDAEESAASSLEVILHQNIAACYLKKEDPKMAIQHCNKALALDPNAWKAKLRKGEAYIQRESFDEAKTILEEALKCTDDPDNKLAIQAALTKREKQIKVAEKEAQKRLRAMFFGSSKPTSTSSTLLSGGGKTEEKEN